MLPASELIHDRMVTLFHPLIGVSPIYACAASATQGNRIQANSAKFFENMSRPSGQLTAPGKIDDVTASRIKRDFEANFGNGNIGRLFVAGDGLKYEAMTIPPQDAQLIQQLGWTVEDVARAFKVPLQKLAVTGTRMAQATAQQFNEEYYGHTLQKHIEDIELLLDEGLKLPDKYGVELEIETLLRMDPQAMATTNELEIRAGYLKPNEARLRKNLPPVPGGDTPYMQQQNYSLAALDARDRAGPAPAAIGATAVPAPGGAPKLPAPETPMTPPTEAPAASAMAAAFIKGLEDADVCIG